MPGRAEGPGRPLQIWLDAQLPPSLAEWMHQEYGIDAVHLETLGLLGSKDEDVFNAARTAESAVVILTKDADFQKLLSQRGPPPHVVWIRTGNVSNRELREIILRAWPGAAALIDQGESLVEIRRRGS